jgi:hypothetical protein
LDIGALLSTGDQARDQCDPETFNRSNALFSSIRSTNSIKGHVRVSGRNRDILRRVVLASITLRNQSRRAKMTRLTVAAILLGFTLLAGCSVSKEGFSLSEYKFVDNNCTGNGFLVNESWCRDTLKASMGPYSN